MATKRFRFLLLVTLGWGLILLNGNSGVGAQDIPRPGIDKVEDAGLKKTIRLLESPEETRQLAGKLKEILAARLISLVCDDSPLARVPKLKGTPVWVVGSGTAVSSWGRFTKLSLSLIDQSPCTCSPIRTSPSFRSAITSSYVTPAPVNQMNSSSRINPVRLN